MGRYAEDHRPLGGRPQELRGDVVWEGSYSGTGGAWFVPPLGRTHMLGKRPRQQFAVITFAAEASDGLRGIWHTRRDPHIQEALLTRTAGGLSW